MSSIDSGRFGLQDDSRWQLADPICTFIFAILVLLTTKAILQDIWDILMERVPRQIDINQLEQGMLAVWLYLSSTACPHAWLKRLCTDAEIACKFAVSFLQHSHLHLALMQPPCLFAVAFRLGIDAACPV